MGTDSYGLVLHLTKGLVNYKLIINARRYKIPQDEMRLKSINHQVKMKTKIVNDKQIFVLLQKPKKQKQRIKIKTCKWNQFKHSLKGPMIVLRSKLLNY